MQTNNDNNQQIIQLRKELAGTQRAFLMMQRELNSLQMEKVEQALQQIAQDESALLAESTQESQSPA